MSERAQRTMSSPMWKVSLRNLAAHKVRLALTVLSVVLGTAFVAGSFVFTDSLRSTFDGIFEDQAKGVDVRVSGADSSGPLGPGGGVPLAAVDAIAATPGVRAVAPSVSGQVVLLTADGKAVQTGGAPSVGGAYLPPDRSLEAPLEFVGGRPPERAGEFALNVGAADRAGLAIGARTRVLVPAVGLQDVTLTGLYRSPIDTGGFVGALFDDAQARTLFTDGEHVGYVDVAAEPGVDRIELRDRLQREFPDLTVHDGDQVRAELKGAIGDALKFVNYFLLAFGAIALLVGTFIIYNTFSMIVAQRLRELALLRAVGASRGQVGRSVVLEALVVGLVGSALGLAAGVGLAYGLSGLLNAFEVGLPTATLRLAPRTVAVALLVGVVVTTLSAYAPARRAATIPPVAAMREEFASTGESLRRRTVAGAVLAVAGVVLVVLGARSSGESAATTVGAGALCLLLAVLLALPALSRPAIGLLGAGPARWFGTVGRLARGNAVRNPRRTAATAFALTLGLMLVAAIGTLGASAKRSVDAAVDTGVRADYVLSGPSQVGVPPAAAMSAAHVPGVAQAVSMQFVAAKAGAESAGNGVAFRGPRDDVTASEIIDGSGDIGDDGMLVSATTSAKRGWRVGDSVTLTGYRGNTETMRVSGIYRDTQILADWVVPERVYEAMTPANLRADLVVLVRAAPGADVAGLRSKLEQATDPYVVVQVLDRDQFKGRQAGQIDTLLAVLYGLLALAIVIAILGIVNTLALSVVERRREIGMLRAVGTQRSQVRRAIYLESALIAVFGAIVGVALGLGLGSAFIRTLRDQGIDRLAIPWGQVVLMLVASGVVGVVAALLPAIRAARTPPLAAIADL